MTRLLAGSSAVRIPSDKIYCSLRLKRNTGPEVCPNFWLLSIALTFFHAGKTIGGVRLTTALHLVRRFKMSGVIPLLPYRTETNLPLFSLQNGRSGFSNASMLCSLQGTYWIQNSPEQNTCLTVLFFTCIQRKLSLYLCRHMHHPDIFSVFFSTSRQIPYNYRTTHRTIPSIPFPADRSPATLPFDAKQSQFLTIL